MQKQDYQNPIKNLEYSRHPVIEIDPSSEARMKIRCRDWIRIREAIKNIPESRNIWSSVATTSLGVGIEGILASIPLWSTEGEIELWIKVAFLFLTILSFIISLLACISAKQKRVFITQSVKSILAEIMDIESTMPDILQIQPSETDYVSN